MRRHIKSRLRPSSTSWTRRRCPASPSARCATSLPWCHAGRCHRSASSPGRGLASPACGSIRPATALELLPTGTGITLQTIGTTTERTIKVPADAHIALIGFSPDGKRLAFTDTRDTRIDLYVADVATGATRVADGALNTIVGGCSWLTDSSALLCPFVATDRGAPPAAPRAPSGPNIQENRGPGGPIPTFQDLLTNAHDEAMFEFLRLVTARLRRRRDRTPLDRRQARHRHRRRVA